MQHVRRLLAEVVVRSTREGSFAWVSTLGYWCRLPPGVNDEDDVRAHFKKLQKTGRSNRSLQIAIRDAAHFPIRFEKGVVPDFFKPPAPPEPEQL